MSTVPKRLQDLGDLFEQRGKVYGEAYKKYGEQAFLMIGPISLATPEDFGRLALVLQIIAKTARYTNNFGKGGHIDSLDDLSVYAQMLQEIDGEIRSRDENPSS
jgi:hypothetical protein